MSVLKFETSQHPGEIDVNFDALKQQLSMKMDEYAGKVFTEESKKEAKSDLAELRKLKKSVNDRKIAVRDAYMIPYKQFEQKVIELQGMIDRPISYIDGQVKEFEERRVREKKSEIEAAYNEIVPESLYDYIPLETIFNPKWTNTTTAMKSIRQDLADISVTTSSDVNAISAMSSDKVDDALSLYMETRNLASAMKLIADYENRKAEILKKKEEEDAERREREIAAERERVRREERERIAAEERIRNEAKKSTADDIKSVDKAEAAPLSSRDSQTIVYTVVATPEEQQAIEMALTSLGVYFERKDV